MQFDEYNEDSSRVNLEMSEVVRDSFDSYTGTPDESKWGDVYALR